MTDVEAKYAEFGTHMDKLVVDATRRIDEAQRSQKDEATRFHRIAQEETSLREKAMERLQRDMDRLSHQLEEEAGQRQADQHGNTAATEHLRDLVSNEQKERMTSIDELADRVGQTRRAVTEETKDRLAGDSELQA